MKNKIMVFICCLLILSLTGCRNYTIWRDKGKANSNVNEQAVQEELDAVKNAPVLMKDGMPLWDKLNSLGYFEYAYDKKNDGITLTSGNMEITSTGKDVTTINFIIFNDHPLDKEKVSGELFEVMKIISEYLDVTYNEHSVIESISNVDYSKSRDIYTNDYADNIKLFSNLWNNGVKDCIDFRIIRSTA